MLLPTPDACVGGWLRLGECFAARPLYREVRCWRQAVPRCHPVLQALLQRQGLVSSVENLCCFFSNGPLKGDCPIRAQIPPLPFAWPQDCPNRRYCPNRRRQRPTGCC